MRKTILPLVLVTATTAALAIPGTLRVITEMNVDAENHQFGSCMRKLPRGEFAKIMP